MFSKMRPGLLVLQGADLVKVAIKAGAKIRAAVIAEGFDGLAGAGVYGGEETRVNVQQAAVGTVFAFPVVDAARPTAPWFGWAQIPFRRGVSATTELLFAAHTSRRR